MNRRGFLIVSVSGLGALAIGCGRRRDEVVHRDLVPLVSIGDDDSITVHVARTEMGQGVTTALPMLLADELDADWSRVAIENRRFDPALGDQITTASVTIFDSWTTYREAGAAARALLVAEAAGRWKVAADQLRTESGAVIGPTGQRATYGSLVAGAAQRKLDGKPPLKQRFTLVGKPLGRLDTPSKVDGSAEFGIDVRVENMLVGCVARAPTAGATVASFDATAARGIEGVREVVPITSGIAVLADDTWTAMQGVKALAVTWTGGAAFDTASHTATLLKELELPHTPIHAIGDVDAALAAGDPITATYSVPFVPHATMEPVNATASVGPGRCTIWAPTQAPSWNQKVVAKLLGIPEAAVDVHRTFVGGGFGRKSCQDFVIDAVEASRAVKRPVQIVYTREDDIRHDLFRPMFAHKLSGAVAGGKIVAWEHRLVGPSVVKYWHPFAKLKAGEVDGISTAGAGDLPYAVPAFRAASREVDLGVPVGIWRSIAHSYTTFANECFVDELAVKAKQDPLAFRLANASNARGKHVLELAAEKADWAHKGERILGCALQVEAASDDDYAVHVAHVIELERRGQGFAIARVVVAADCGAIVNPSIVTAQLEGGAAWALSAMQIAITHKAGAVEQSNFHDVPIVRMPQMPKVEVHLVASTARASGIGEKGVPSFAPAFANAMFAATGIRLRAMPFATKL